MQQMNERQRTRQKQSSRSRCVHLPALVAISWALVFSIALSTAPTFGQTWSSLACRTSQHWLEPDHLSCSFTDEGQESEPEEDEAETEEEFDDFFTEPTVLWPGQAKVQTTFSFDMQDLLYPVILSDDSAGLDRTRISNFTVSNSVCFGLRPGIEAYCNLPFRFLHVEYSDPEFEDSDSEISLADINAGVNSLLWRSCDESTSLVGSVDATFPTGRDAFGLSSFDNAYDSGFWIVWAGLEFSKTTEEEDVEVYGGFGYSHYFPAKYFGVQVEKADAISCWFGANWYLTDDIWLDATFYGDYQDNSRFDGEIAYGTSYAPMALRLTLGKDRECGRTLEPFVQFGLNDDRKSVLIGLTASRFFP